MLITHGKYVMIGSGKGWVKIELRVLNYFLMVAREENITKAAQLPHVTQPTLSRQIAQLEEEFRAGHGAGGL